MKKLLIIPLLTALAAFAGEPYTGHRGGVNPGCPTDLNSTVAQLTSRYGKPVMVEKGWYGAGLSYEFHPAESLYVYATTTPDQTRVEDVIYTQFTGKPFTAAEKSHLLVHNSDPHITYYGDSIAFGTEVEWDGTEQVKRLGKEHNLTLKSDLNWTHQIVTKETDNGSYQIRTKAQFDREQKFLK
jgi:hypothetical protein